MTEDTTPAAVPDEAAGLVRTVAPFLMAQRLRRAERRITELEARCDSVIASTPEGEVPVMTVSTVLGILGSKKEGDRG